MNTFQTLYTLLGIRQKITDQSLRLLYLKEVWGLDQHDSALVEGISQSKVSRLLKEGRITHGTAAIANIQMIQFEGEEIKMIMALPREVLNDTQLIAFVHDILGVYPIHPFYALFNQHTNYRIAALHDLGVQQKHLVKIYNKNQSTISMMCKKLAGESWKKERGMRYDLSGDLKLQAQRYNNKFIIASQ